MRLLTLLLGAIIPAGVAAAQVEQVPLFDLRGHRNAVRQLVFLPDGEHLLSVGDSGSVIVWKLKTHRPVRRLTPTVSARIEGALNLLPSRKVERIALAPDGHTLVEAVTERDRRSVLRVWRVPEGRELRILAEDRSAVRAVAISPDGKRVAANARDVRRFVHYIVLRDISTGREVARLEEQRLSPVRLLFSPDGRWLLAAGSRRLHIWDVAAGRLAHQDNAAHKKAITDMTISRDGKRAATVSTDDTARIWDPATGKRLREIEADQDGLYSVAFSPSGRTLVTGGGDNTTKLWSTRSGKRRKTLWGHVARVTAVAVSPDGKLLATGSRDGTISVWQFSEPAADEEADDETDDDPNE